ncbi:MAG: ATP-binding protein [Geobacteraceae bacterium]|nr:ATP-binding protein [Geobacteraceae bacterium]
MSATVTLAVEELTALRERVSVLAKGSAHLKLINSMLSRMSAVSGLNNVVENILTILMDTIGGSNLTLYYCVGGRWHSRDILGSARDMEAPRDPLVLLCMQAETFVRSAPVVESHPYGEIRQENWAFPLIMQSRVLGVVLMEGMQLTDTAIQGELQPFFVYAALMLGNEISNYNELEIAHNELMEAHQELECEIEARQEAEELYRILFEQSPDGVLLVDPVSRAPIRFNTAAHQQLGYTHEEFATLRIMDIDAISTAEEVEERSRTIMELGFITFEALHRTKGGQLRNVLVTLKALSIDQHRQVLAIHRDITDIKKMEEELLKSQKLESLGVLAGGIAHDFNNLLTAIMGKITLAANCLDPASRAVTLLEASEKACLRARGLTQQLLTFAKGGAPAKQLLSIAEVVRESASFALRGSAVRCEFRIPADLWSAEVDTGQISQVIHNLIVNAEQAMPAGGVIKVTCTNMPDLGHGAAGNRWIRIDIQDSGIGILPEYLHKIFDPYFTTKQKGSGLGLASSYSIISKHDGRIEVESTPGVGTTFHVYLPATGETAARNLPEAMLEPSRRRRILVMDDEEIILDVVAEMLGFLGHEVEKVHDGVEALQLYQRELTAGRRFDLVILDLTVPGAMGGKDAVNQLLKLDPEAKAVVSSGYANDTTVSEFKSCGFAGVLSKPYTLLDIAKVLADLFH